MIVLDTNVISEVARPSPDPKVVAWTDSLAEAGGAVAAVTLAELFLGLRLMPRGARRDEKSSRVIGFLAHLATLPFDAAAAEQYADIVASRRAAGRPIMPFDAQIAATARAHGAALATRDAVGFAGCGVEVIDPWTVLGD